MVSVWVMPVRVAMRPVTTEAKSVVLPHPDGDEVGPAGDGADLGHTLEVSLRTGLSQTRPSPRD